MTWRRAGINDVAKTMGQAYADGLAVGIEMPPHGTGERRGSMTWRRGGSMTSA